MNNVDEISVDRSMASHPAGKHRGFMDEATIDCYCSAPGVAEMQCQELSDRADWVTYHRCIRCADHLISLLECHL